METKDHYYLAKHLNKNMEMGMIKGAAFLLGNLIPDANPYSYLSFAKPNPFKGHNYSSRKQIFVKVCCKEIHNSVYGWYRAGNLLHSLADAFTRPHNEEFSYDLSEHIRYEHMLHKTFHKHVGKYQQNSIERLGDGRDACEWIVRMHQEYMKSSAGVWEDCQYILYVTTAIYNQIQEWIGMSTTQDILPVTQKSPNF